MACSGFKRRFLYIPLFIAVLGLAVGGVFGRDIKHTYDMTMQVRELKICLDQYEPHFVDSVHPNGTMSREFRIDDDLDEIGRDDIIGTLHQVFGTTYGYDVHTLDEVVDMMNIQKTIDGHSYRMQEVAACLGYDVVFWYPIPGPNWDLTIDDMVPEVTDDPGDVQIVMGWSQGAYIADKVARVSGAVDGVGHLCGVNKMIDVYINIFAYYMGANANYFELYGRNPLPLIMDLGDVDQEIIEELRETLYTIVEDADVRHRTDPEFPDLNARYASMMHLDLPMDEGRLDIDAFMDLIFPPISYAPKLKPDHIERWGNISPVQTSDVVSLLPPGIPYEVIERYEQIEADPDVRAEIEQWDSIQTATDYDIIACITEVDTLIPYNRSLRDMDAQPQTTITYQGTLVYITTRTQHCMMPTDDVLAMIAVLESRVRGGPSGIQDLVEVVEFAQEHPEYMDFLGTLNDFYERLD